MDPRATPLVGSWNVGLEAARLAGPLLGAQRGRQPVDGAEHRGRSLQLAELHGVVVDDGHVR